MKSTLQRSLSGLLVVGLALHPFTAHASLFGEENVPLTALVVNSAAQINQFAAMIKQAKDTYDQTKAYVGMAQDAVKAFDDARRFGEAIITRPDSAFEQLFPDAASLRREIESPSGWAQGTGELQRRIQVCLNGETGCAEFYERVRGDQAQKAISSTFGTVSTSVKRDDIRAMDSEAANGLVAASMQEGRATVSRQQYEALLKKCVDATGSDMTSCQAAANMASILQASGTADVNEQLATANRLKAIDVASQSAAQKREVLEAQQRADAVRAGFRDMSKVTIVPLTDVVVPNGGSL